MNQNTTARVTVRKVCSQLLRYDCSLNLSPAILEGVTFLSDKKRQKARGLFFSYKQALFHISLRSHTRRSTTAVMSRSFPFVWLILSLINLTNCLGETCDKECGLYLIECELPTTSDYHNFARVETFSLNGDCYEMFCKCILPNYTMSWLDIAENWSHDCVLQDTSCFVRWSSIFRDPMSPCDRPSPNTPIPYPYAFVTEESLRRHREQIRAEFLLGVNTYQVGWLDISELV